MNPSTLKQFAHLFVFLFIAFLALACESDPNVQPGNSVAFPDFSTCNCDTDSLAIVCTSDGKWFRNACYANCIGVNNLADSVAACPDSIVNPLDTLTWPINMICHPVLPGPPIVARLSDSTFIFQVNDSTFVRGIPYDICRCLPATTLISTPEGSKNVSSLKIGDTVYTQNLAGELEIQPIIQMNRVPVHKDHKLLQLCLDDGRELSLTPEHPGIDGIGLDRLQIGEKLDGSLIRSKEIIDFAESETWDILPGGETGFYKANGIWIGSTLKQQVPVHTRYITD